MELGFTFFKRMKKGLYIFLVLLLCVLSVWQTRARPRVDSFGEHVSVSLHPVEVSAVKSIQNRVTGYSGVPLEVDERLVLVARKLAGRIASDLSRHSNILSSSLPSELRLKYGIYENSVRMRGFIYSTVGDLESQLKLRFKDKQISSTHLGVGVEPPGKSRPGVAVVVLTEKRVDLSPFPRKVRVSSSHPLKGSLVYSTRGMRPKVSVTYPSGKTVSLEDVKVRHDYFRAVIDFDDGPGTYRVEVVATDKKNSKVGALLKVKATRSSDALEEVRGEEPSSPAATSSTWEVEGFKNRYETEQEAEEAMVKMINQVRKKEGLSELKVHHQLKDMARAHSRDMKENDFSGHYSPRRGAMESRARAAGLYGIQVRENIAVSSNFVQAMNNLLQSPVHREPILDPQLNRVGVGVVFDDSSGTRHYYITQEFARL
ncbi:MAG: CAP domain-containing protein [bacterium]